jgi:threonine aldolase
VICDIRAHVYNYEASGIAYHNGATLIPVPPKEGFRHLTADVVEKHLIVDDDIHHAPTKVICLENTLNGEVRLYSSAQNTLVACFCRCLMTLELDFPTR